MAGKVVSGSRCRLIIDGKAVGIFNNVSYSMNYDTQPAYILGRYSAATIEYTGAEPINVTATGWRVVGAGAHEGAKLPHLQALLNQPFVSLAIEDRATGKLIMKVAEALVTGYSTTVSSRQLEEITVTFVGLVLEDESGDNAEAAESMNITDLARDPST